MHKAMTGKSLYKNLETFHSFSADAKKIKWEINTKIIENFIAFNLQQQHRNAKDGQVDQWGGHC